MNDQTASKEITIAGYSFNVPQPFMAGHIVSEAEAKALNQVLAENIRNNTASKVKAAMEGTQKDGDPTSETIVAYVDNYANSYEFTLASAGGGKRPTDPIEVEAFKIARGNVADWAKGKGFTIKALKEKIGEDKYEAKVAEIAERDDVVKEAKRRVDVRVKQAASAMDDLDLGELDTVAAE